MSSSFHLEPGMGRLKVKEDDVIDEVREKESG